MGMIKLPENSIKFFEDHCNEIFESGNLAEGKWNEEVAKWCSQYTGAEDSLAFNSNGAGLFTILRLLNIYGKGMSSSNIMSDVIKQLSFDGPIILQNKFAIRDFVYINDVT